MGVVVVGAGLVGATVGVMVLVGVEVFVGADVDGVLEFGVIPSTLEVLFVVLFETGGVFTTTLQTLVLNVISSPLPVPLLFVA